MRFKRIDLYSTIIIFFLQAIAGSLFLLRGLTDNFFMLKLGILILAWIVVFDVILVYSSFRKG